MHDAADPQRAPARHDGRRSGARSRAARVFVRDHVIEAVGAGADLPQTADEVIDARDQIVIPGLVNTHHHMYQTLTRVIRPAQDCELFDWLQTLYPIWAGLTPEMVRGQHADGDGRTAAVGLHDEQRPPLHLPQRRDARATASRPRSRSACASTPRAAAMSVGQSQGGLPPDSVVESEAAILKRQRSA